VILSTVSVVDELNISMKHFMSCTNRWKPKNAWAGDLPQCHFVHYKSHKKQAWDQTWVSAIKGRCMAWPNVYHLGSLLYPVSTVCHFTDRSAWRQAEQRSPLYQFAMNGGFYVLVPRIAVIIRIGFLLILLKQMIRFLVQCTELIFIFYEQLIQVVWNWFLSFSDMRHIQRTQFFYNTSTFCGCNWRQYTLNIFQTIFNVRLYPQVKKKRLRGFESDKG